MVKAKGAVSIEILFETIRLPENGKLIMYSPKTKERIKPITRNDLEADSIYPLQISSNIIYNDSVIIEYWEPLNTSTHGDIEIGGLIYGYRKFDYKTSGDPSEDCFLDARCSSEGLQNAIYGVLRVTALGWNCTGFLINNVNEDKKPYVFTADHCLDFDGVTRVDAINHPSAHFYDFYFIEERECCDYSLYSDEVFKIDGATAIANNANTDMALFELSEDPLNESGNVYYYGWDISETKPYVAFCFHHPLGYKKKMSTAWGRHNIHKGEDRWIIDWPAHYYTTAFGSSGSPLFYSNSSNQSIDQVIGWLSSGYSKCGEDLGPDYAPMLSRSWNLGSDKRRRLKEWLDPSGTGAQSLNGRFFKANQGAITWISDHIFNCKVTLRNDIVEFHGDVKLQNEANVTIKSNSFEIYTSSGSFEVETGTLFTVD